VISSFIRSKTTYSFRNVLRNILREYRIMRMHQKGVAKARSLVGQTRLKLHVGCGQNIKPGWVNVDLEWAADLTLDLREPIPLDDGSCEIVYSEHFFEHLEHPTETVPFLREAFRVLAQDGEFSIGIPDAEWPIRAYAGDPLYDGWFDYVRSVYPALNWLNTRADLVNYSFRNGVEHKYAWDFQTLKRALEETGFTHVFRRDFDPSIDSESRHYAFGTNKVNDTTLYATARRP
jgi:predicted SAM-dependent methyltransferase